MPARFPLSAASRWTIAALVAALLAAALVPSPVGAATSTTAASSAPTCGGRQPLKPGGGRYRCTFDDEFTATRLNRTLWTVERTAASGFHSGAECMVDDPRAVAVSRGTLNLTVRDTGRQFTCAAPRGSYRTRFISGSVYSTAFAQQFGRFEVRARFAQGHGRRGTQGALWLYPKRVTALGVATGPTEIDIAEAYSNYPNLIAPNVHGFTTAPSMSLLPLPGLAGTCPVPDWGGAFHTYAVVWTRAAVSFEYDGRVCRRVATPTGAAQALIQNPFRVVLSQALGIGRNTPDARTVLPATLQIDYVRVWR